MSSDFYEVISSKGLGAGEAERTLSKMRATKLLDLTADLQERLPVVAEASTSKFGFLANSALSGGPDPCSEAGCRLAKADELARFAALYADEVLIRNPFARYDEENDAAFLRNGLAADLAVLRHLQPLVENGLVAVAETSFALCGEHDSDLIKASERLRTNLTIAENILAEQYGPQLTYTYEDTGFVGVQGPDSIVPHGAQFVGPLAPDVALHDGVVRPELKDALLRRQLLEPVLNDVFLHDWYKNQYEYRYLTDRQLDIAVIDAVSSEEVKQINHALLNGLEHAVPVVGNVDVGALVALRREEGEAFNVYRDAVAKVLRDADLSTPKRIADAFEQAIRPELNKLELAAANARKLTKREIKRDVVISAGLVSVGLILGLVQPAIGAVTTALGGWKAAKDIGGKLFDLAAEPPKVRENPFYFLWRVEQAARPKFEVVMKE